MDCLHLSCNRRLGCPRLHLCLSYQGQQGCCLSGGAVRAADESDFQLLNFTAVQALLETQRRFWGTPTLPSKRARRRRSRGQQPWTASKPRRRADQRGGGDLLHGHGHAWNRGCGPWGRPCRSSPALLHSNAWTWVELQFVADPHFATCGEETVWVGSDQEGNHNGEQCYRHCCLPCSLDLSAILADRDAWLTLANDDDMQTFQWDCYYFLCFVTALRRT